MPRDRRRQIGVVRVADYEVPSTLSHFEAAREIEALQIVLTPTERRPANAGEKLLGSLHEPTLASARQSENVPVQIRARATSRARREPG